MLNNCRNAQERWGGAHQLIDRWLQERHELVLAHKELLDRSDVPMTDLNAMQRYCQTLVDYASSGHFEFYDLLNSEAEDFNDQRGLELAQQIYPRLEASTEAVLAFNDLCDSGNCTEGAQLVQKLQRLGALLLERFDLEDCLIEVLHNAHQEQAVASNV